MFWGRNWGPILRGNYQVFGFRLRAQDHQLKWQLSKASTLRFPCSGPRSDGFLGDWNSRGFGLQGLRSPG